jgi:N-acetylglucosaminyldiphosphoundecaprenol N-acetyl-beta-D-mannosaminyltransferase
MIVELAGVKVDNVTMDQALKKLEEFIAERWPHLIVTPNPEMIVAAQDDEELHNILDNAHLRLPDGISMVVVSNILRCPLKERIAGIDFLLRSVELSALKGYRIFLLGGAPGVAEAAARVLKSKYPNLIIAGTQHGYFSAGGGSAFGGKSSEEQEIVTKIRTSAPDILFAGLGMGRQEKWLARNLADLNVPVSVGVGGSFDVISGIKRRAPKWIQGLYIEWLYRLITEPQRWKRQLALPKFLWLTLVKNVIIRFK